MPITGTATTVCTATPITLSDASAGGTWSSYDANAIVSSGGVVTGVTAGTDVISYSITNVCNTATVTYTITVSTCGARDINDTTGKPNDPLVNDASMDIKVFPNPSTGILYIQASVSVDVKLSTIDGRMLIDQKEATQLDMNYYANGVYFISIFDHNTGLLLKTDRVIKTGN